MRTLQFALVIIVVFGCKSDSKQQLFSAGKPLGKADHRLKEASGLVASVNHPGYFWTVNDSGNPPEVFLIDDHAQIKMVCRLAGIKNRDWEDIGMGVGKEAGKNYLYVGDIGDNDALHEFKFIYRFEEPLDSAGELLVTGFDTLVLRMPDGHRDTETLMIDPLTHDFYLVSKREQSVGLYRAAYPFANDTMMLEKTLTMPFTKIVAGSISSDGQEVLLKDYDHVFYWNKLTNESITQLLSKKPSELDYEREPLGEAIAWSLDGMSFYTLSESTKEERSSLLEYKRKK